MSTRSNWLLYICETLGTLPSKAKWIYDLWWTLVSLLCTRNMLLLIQEYTKIRGFTLTYTGIEIKPRLAPSGSAPPYIPAKTVGFCGTSLRCGNVKIQRLWQKHRFIAKNTGLRCKTSDINRLYIWAHFPHQGHSFNITNNTIFNVKVRFHGKWT